MLNAKAPLIDQRRFFYFTIETLVDQYLFSLKFVISMQAALATVSRDAAFTTDRREVALALYTIDLLRVHSILQDTISYGIRIDIQSV